MLTYIHGLPDDTWMEPQPDDPLSIVDQVYFLFDEFTVESTLLVGNFVKGGACPRLQVPGEYHKQEAARVHPLQQRGQYPAD